MVASGGRGRSAPTPAGAAGAGVTTQAPGGPGRSKGEPVARRLLPCPLTAPAPAHHAGAPLRLPVRAARAVRTPPIDGARPSHVGTLARRSRF
jgi:hypothetical protein